MKNDFMQAKSLMTQKDWEKLMNMSEAEIEENAKSDVDNPPFSLKNSASRAMLLPDGTIVRSISIDQKIDLWFQEHNLETEKVAAVLLKQFVEAQIGMK